MSAPMKKLLTESIVIGKSSYQVPVETAKAVLVLIKGSAIDDENDTILADESSVIKNLDKKYSRAGVCLQGARLKEGLSQVELAEKLGTIQANISAMEHGKRPIGKVMAKRLSKVLHIDYRVFL